MKIKCFGFGNDNEAFIENRFKDNVNVIFSNDNNKGKTLVLQGIMHCIGNEAVFPSGFDQKNYYFYLKASFDSSVVEFLRKNRTIIIKTESSIQICNTISEFKHVLKKYIPELPEIIKKDQPKLVDPALFYELFFIGQDKRDPSNIFTRGFYNKNDFVNMLYSYAGVSKVAISSCDIKNIKEEISNKTSRQSALTKELKRFKINPDVSKFVMKSVSNEEFQKKNKIIEGIRKNISETERSKNRELNRKYKLQHLLIELNSLNRNIEIGEVVCSDCGSDKIIYKNHDLSFEVSNNYVRNSIVKSIKDNIMIKEEIIEELSQRLDEERGRLKNEIRDTTPETRDLFLFKDQIDDSSKMDDEITDINQKVLELKEQLKISEETSKADKNKQEQFTNSVLASMNSYYKKIDPNGNLVFDNLFTKKDQTFSGSEEQEFYFCKIVSLKDYFNHSFPIIIDSFRDGEISTAKEKLMLEIFKKTSSQVILTSTLKDEEYSSTKYPEDQKLNSLDYSSNKDSKILSSDDSKEFLKILESFNLELSATGI